MLLLHMIFIKITFQDENTTLQLVLQYNYVRSSGVGGGTMRFSWSTQNFLTLGAYYEIFENFIFQLIKYTNFWINFFFFFHIHYLPNFQLGLINKLICLFFFSLKRVTDITFFSCINHLCVRVCVYVCVRLYVCEF